MHWSAKFVHLFKHLCKQIHTPPEHITNALLTSKFRVILGSPAVIIELCIVLTYKLKYRFWLRRTICQNFQSLNISNCSHFAPAAKHMLVFIGPYRLWCLRMLRVVVCIMETRKSGVNSLKEYKCALQVGPLFLQILTNLNPLKVFRNSH